VKVYRKSLMNRNRVSTSDADSKEVEKPEPPVPRISRVQQDGLVEISFS